MSRLPREGGLATATIWLANLIICVVVPEMVINLGWGTCLFSGCFCFAAAIFSFSFVPETWEKSLEQIAAMFGDELNREATLKRQLAEKVLREKAMAQAMEPHAQGYDSKAAAALDTTGQYKSVFDTEVNLHGDDSRVQGRSNSRQIRLCLQVDPCEVCVPGGSVVRATDRHERRHSARR